MGILTGALPTTPFDATAIGRRGSWPGPRGPCEPTRSARACHAPDGDGDDGGVAVKGTRWLPWDQGVVVARFGGYEQNVTDEHHSALITAPM